MIEPVTFADLRGWRADDHAAALAAFGRSAAMARTRRCRDGALGICFDSLGAAFADACGQAGGDARGFFERHFLPCRVDPGEAATGFVTGYYEPVVEASRQPSGRFAVPLLARPADLVEIGEERPSGLDPVLSHAMATEDGLREYFDRGEIESGALADRGLAIAWLEDRVEAFFIHVQGSARLRFGDGTEIRVSYAGKTGHPFTGPGGVLADLGEIARAEVTMRSIKAWFRDNPGRVDEILWQNRSYIFFREAPVADPAAGPIGAAKVPLTAGRSIAVDRLLHTFGTPIFVDAARLSAVDGQPFRRLMIAQDTGSAIVGPARGDLFIGTGEAAGEIAGVIRERADFFALVPRALLAEAAG